MRRRRGVLRRSVEAKSFGRLGASITHRRNARGVGGEGGRSSLASVDKCLAESVVKGGGGYE
jgi:hypothetical protein